MKKNICDACRINAARAELKSDHLSSPVKKYGFIGMRPNKKGSYDVFSVAEGRQSKPLFVVDDVSLTCRCAQLNKKVKQAA